MLLLLPLQPSIESEQVIPVNFFHSFVRSYFPFSRFFLHFCCYSASSDRLRAWARCILCVMSTHTHTHTARAYTFHPGLALFRCFYGLFLSSPNSKYKHISFSVLDNAFIIRSTESREQRMSALKCKKGHSIALKTGINSTGFRQNSNRIMCTMYILCGGCVCVQCLIYLSRIHESNCMLSNRCCQPRGTHHRLH